MNQIFSTFFKISFLLKLDQSKIRGCCKFFSFATAPLVFNLLVKYSQKRWQVKWKISKTPHLEQQQNNADTRKKEPCSAPRREAVGVTADFLEAFFVPLRSTSKASKNHCTILWLIFLLKMGHIYLQRRAEREKINKNILTNIAIFANMWYIFISFSLFYNFIVVEKKV